MSIAKAKADIRSKITEMESVYKDYDKKRQELKSNEDISAKAKNRALIELEEKTAEAISTLSADIDTRFEELQKAADGYNTRIDYTDVKFNAAISLFASGGMYLSDEVIENVARDFVGTPAALAVFRDILKKAGSTSGAELVDGLYKNSAFDLGNISQLSDKIAYMGNMAICKNHDFGIVLERVDAIPDGEAAVSAAE